MTASMFASLVNVLNLRAHQVVAETQPDEWLKRAAPGTNLPAFILWHVVRALDSGIHMGLQGTSELIDRAPWSDRAWAQPGVGVGMSLADADGVAERVVPSEVLGYADEVRTVASGWLKTLSDDDLEAQNIWIQHAAESSAYSYPAYASQIAWMEGRPVWAVMAISVFGHCWAHLAEIETLRGVLRSSVSVSPLSATTTRASTS
jgi:hypothetical protein